MPANLTPQYQEAEKKYKQATTVQDRMAALEEMMATIPKHKGTEKLQAELRRKMSQLRKESEQDHQKRTAGRAAVHVIERQGACQLALVGAPNSGKSQLLTSLTHATPEVAEYPFTTRIAIPGMMLFENVRLQLVDLPAISPEYTEPWVPQIARNADAILWVVDLSDDNVLDRLDETHSFLRNAKVDLDAMKTLMVANKNDDSAAADRELLVREAVQSRFPVIAISAKNATQADLEGFKRFVYDFLDVVRVYTKAPGKKADLQDPYVVSRGSTVLDVAEKVHRDFVDRLKYARIWGEGKADGIMVPRDFVIDEGDILELHE
jgi:ribosome-interacting GTPase 1